MLYPPILPAAIQAGRPATSLLAYSLRARDQAVDRGLQTIEAQLEAVAGHLHHPGRVRGYVYRAVDPVDIWSSGPLQNNLLDFYYSDDDLDDSLILRTAALSQAVGPAARTPPQLAAAMQAAMLAEVPGAHISVVYVDPALDEAAPLAGRIWTQHTGTGPARVLRLPFASGPNRALNCGIASGYARRDYQLRLGYVAPCGFLHGCLEDTVAVDDGGQIGPAGIADADSSTAGATTAKYAPGLMHTPNFATAAVGAGQTAAAALTGDKTGGPVLSPEITLGPSATNAVGWTMPEDRWPCARVLVVEIVSGAPLVESQLYFSSGPTHVSGNDYAASITNLSVCTVKVRAAAY